MFFCYKIIYLIIQRSHYIMMPFTTKLQSYKLTPDEYLFKFKRPHSVISTKGNPEQYEADQKIVEDILSHGYNDTQESYKIKQQIVEYLTNILHQWLIETDKQMLKKESGQYGLKIFGSYSLKANSIDGDIDMVCLASEQVNRQKAFFGVLVNRLKRDPQISQVKPIPDAFIPLIKLKIHNIQIDLLLSRIPQTYLEKYPDFLSSKERKAGINDKELISINGYRASCYLKKEISHFQNFRIALKAIKMWAKNKGIYSQIHGYLGGAGYSIMLTKILQLYPNYSVLDLLDRFFFIYSHWIWATMPIKIEQTQIEQKQGSSAAVYTPIQPHINTAYLTNKITMNITTKYLKQARQTISKIKKKEAQWKDLFQPSSFFSAYQTYLQFSIMAKSFEQFLIWKGNVESSIRKFLKFLEGYTENIPGIQINPYPYEFSLIHPNYKFCSKYYIGFNINSNTPYEIDLTQPVRNYTEILQNYPGIHKVPEFINIGIAGVQKDSLLIQEMKDKIKFYKLQKQKQVNL